VTGASLAPLAAIALVLGAPRPCPAQAVAASERFELHSDPWINLHHFLYQWARDDLGLGTGRQEVRVPERSSLGRLAGAERRAWERALEFYRDSVAARSHFDEGMLHQKRRLVEMAAEPGRPVPDAIPGIAAALAGAMPVYRTRWWPAHDRTNRSWIASVAPRLRRHEARYVATTRRIYGAAWSRTPLRVDVSAYANPRAGYTAGPHIVIYSTDAGNQELYGLETLLHEAQHVPEIGSAARAALAGAFERAGREVPENLWHALIFATAGEFVRSVAAQERLPAHLPYWIREGFPRLRGWSAVVPAAQEDWLPVVRGETSPERGFEALVGRFAAH
jgi:hypothetical protein